VSRSLAGLGLAIVAGLVVVGVVVASLRPAEPTAESKPDVVVRQGPTPEALTLLGALEIGELIGGWEVLAIEGPVDGEIRVELGRDHQRFSIMVARLGTRTERPPVKTEQYAIYYGHAHPTDTTIPDGAIRASTHAVARRVGATEHEMPVPAGM
jgi:hypothetical protein